MKLPEVVHFRFENPPEALHKAVVDAAAGPGHTLRCMDTVQLCFELPVGVLIASVAVKQRMGAGVGAHRPVKGVKDKLIVVGSAQRIRNEAGCKILCKRFSTKSRMALESRADSGLNPLITESYGGQSGMRAGTA